jgi:hypothetical protein
VTTRTSRVHGCTLPQCSNFNFKSPLRLTEAPFKLWPGPRSDRSRLLCAALRAGKKNAAAASDSVGGSIYPAFPMPRALPAVAMTMARTRRTSGTW